MKRLIIGLTGASGSIYGLRLIEELAKDGYDLHVVATDTARKVVVHELGAELETLLEPFRERVALELIDDFFAPTASGSYKALGMVIAPCSMGTLGSIAHGISSNLLVRSALVCLKERRPLVILARETPLGDIDLENMLKLSRAGATIFPAAPGFYHKPESVADLVDFLVGKVLDHLGIENRLFTKWGERSIIHEQK